MSEETGNGQTLSPRDLLAFTKTGRQGPAEKPVKQRLHEGFVSIYELLTGPKAQEQASRCAQCGVPFCQTGESTVEIGCPLENNIPDWLRLLSQGQEERAVAMAYRTNPMPDVCGSVCPQGKLCEGSCVVNQSGHGAITIGSIEKFLGETAWKNGWVPKVNPLDDLDTSIAIIGTGPGGYAAAYGLANFGHKVTMYERSPLPGGLLTYGIPGFKLDKGAVARYFNLLRDGGIDIKCGVSVGPEGLPFSGLVNQHDAIILATGTYKPKDARLEGNAGGGVIPAIGYLNTQNDRDYGHEIPEHVNTWYSAKDKRVIVIGGGDTAMDCVRTAVRQGATSVTCLYRRDRENMPGSQKEVRAALNEGVDIQYFVQPKEVWKNNGSPFTIKAVRTALEQKNGSGRVGVVETDEVLDFEADMVISAVGFDPEHLPELFNIQNMQLKTDGTLRVSPIHNPYPDKPGAGLVGRAVTGLSNAFVFAVGDIVRGPSLVVQALRDGRDVAGALHDALRDETKFIRKYGHGYGREKSGLQIFDLHAS